MTVTTIPRTLAIGRDAFGPARPSSRSVAYAIRPIAPKEANCHNTRSTVHGSHVIGVKMIAEKVG